LQRITRYNRLIEGQSRQPGFDWKIRPPDSPSISQLMPQLRLRARKKSNAISLKVRGLCDYRGEREQFTY